jgi:hypothetical protein
MSGGRRRRPGGRRWWWTRGPMRVKAPRMSGLGGSSPLWVVQGLSLLLLAFVVWLVVNICWTHVWTTKLDMHNAWTWYNYIYVLLCELDMHYEQDNCW